MVYTNANNSSSQAPHNCVIIAGASGLVGSHALNQLLTHPAIDGVTALSRRPLTVTHPKLSEIISPELSFEQARNRSLSSQLGIIALGTTRQQAGSRSDLERVDYDLVCQVAQRMKNQGVTRLAVVSSYGANPRSWFHYLRCKGRAEQTIGQMRFEQVTFVRPGPLLGTRKRARIGEVWLQHVMKYARYLMFGRLKNVIPISASDVASVMIDSLLHYQQSSVCKLNAIDMRLRLAKNKNQTK